MLYTKIKLKDGTVVTTDIRPDNIFTKCSECGKETPVCLNRLFRSDCSEPLTAKIVCSDCTKKNLEPEIKPGLLLALTSTLADLGFGKEIISVYEDFGIDELNELKPKDYHDFVDAMFATIADAD